MIRRKRTPALLGVALILTIAWLVCKALAPYTGDGLRPAVQHHDLNLNRKTEDYRLENGNLVITEAGKDLWRSPAGWRVTSFCAAEVTHDRKQDLLLVVWKEGNFGPSRPFWHTGPDRRLSCHLFVFKLTGHILQPIWMSSALDRPIRSLRVLDIDGDGRNEILVIEYKTWRQHLTNPISSGETTVWRWQDWGFFRVGI